MNWVKEVHETQGYLGKGTYGEVFKVLYPTMNWVVAKKETPKEKDGRLSASFLTELNTFTSVPRGEGIIKFYDILWEENKVSLILELAETDLKHWVEMIDFENRVEWLPEFFSQLGAGLQALHTYGLIHNDLKPENILIKKGRFLLCDFGLSGPAVRLKQQSDILGGTIWSRAPESLAQRLLNYPLTALDLWSLGLSALYLLTSEFFIRGKEPEDILELIRTNSTTELNSKDFLNSIRNGKISGTLYLEEIIEQYNVPDLEAELLEKLCSLNPADRPTTDQLSKRVPPIINYPVSYPEAVQETGKKLWDDLAKFDLLPHVFLLSFELGLRYSRQKVLGWPETIIIIKLAERFLLEEIIVDTRWVAVMGISQEEFVRKSNEITCVLGGMLYNPHLERFAVFSEMQMMPGRLCPIKQPEISNWNLKGNNTDSSSYLRELETVTILHLFPERAGLLDQLHKIWYLERLQVKTFYLGVSFFDQYLSENAVNATDRLLLGLICLGLADIFCDYNSSFGYQRLTSCLSAEDRPSREIVETWRRKVMRVVKIPVLAYDFLSDNDHRFHYLMKVSVLGHHTRNVLPSKLATSIKQFVNGRSDDPLQEQLRNDLQLIDSSFYLYLLYDCPQRQHASTTLTR